MRRLTAPLIPTLLTLLAVFALAIPAMGQIDLSMAVNPECGDPPPRA
jgi:hypothetical protein